jgi:hypothetical protein
MPQAGQAALAGSGCGKQLPHLGHCEYESGITLRMLRAFGLGVQK